MVRLFSLAGAAIMAFASPAMAQMVVGVVSGTITNSTTATIYKTQQSCNNCTYNGTPTSTIAGNGGTGTFSFTGGQYGGMSTLQYSASSGGHTYTCQYQISNPDAVPGSCGVAPQNTSPNYSVSATAGYNGSPHCTATFNIDQTTCNVNASLGYLP